jgi:hypothetical protein
MPVGILQKWFGTAGTEAYNEVTGYAAGAGLSSPFIPSTSHLSVVMAPDLPDGPVSVGKALGVPPVSRAIALYSTVVASFPLAAVAGTTPTWCSRTTGAVTPGHRWAAVLQDLLFTNASVLWKDDVDEDYRPVNSLSRVPRDRWNVDAEGFVEIDGQRRDSRHLVYIPGLMPQGFLDYGRASVNHYHHLQAAILNRASNPVPLLDLHINDSTFVPEPVEDGEESEVEEIARKWSTARSSKHGAVAVSPHWLDVKALGDGKMDMLVEARNAVRLDVANYLNINAAMLDGNNGTSDTYSNTLQNKNEFLTLSLRMFLEPIEQRLSQDDVTPEGTVLKFDTSTFDTDDTAKGNAGSAVAPAENGTDE